jgi:hypothetical protein
MTDRGLKQLQRARACLLSDVLSGTTKRAFLNNDFFADRDTYVHTADRLCPASGRTGNTSKTKTDIGL